MARPLEKMVESLEARISVANGTNAKTPIGIVCPKDGHIRTMKEIDGVWTQTFEDPLFSIPLKLEPILLRPKRFIIIVGGRGSGKSQSLAAIESMRLNDLGVKLACFREFQNSIEDSVYSLLYNQINSAGYEGFKKTNTSIKSNAGGEAKFRGLAI